MCELCDNIDKRFYSKNFSDYDSGVFTKDNILRLYNQGGYDWVDFKCKFCPICGRKLNNKEINNVQYI